MSGALEYHRATNVDAHGTDEDEARVVTARPQPFKDYGEAERLPLEISIAGPLLQDGAGIVRSQPGRDYGGRTMHWRSYSSAGGLFPVEAYVAEPEGLYSFDPLTPGLVPLRSGHAHAEVSKAVGADANTFVVLSGIHARTGWKYLERGYRHIWWDAGTMLANLLALAAADGLLPRLYTGFVDRELNDALSVDGVNETALAVLGLHGGPRTLSSPATETAQPQPCGPRYPLAEAAHAAGELHDLDAVRAWRTNQGEDERASDGPALREAMRQRSSVRRYGKGPLPLHELEELLAWSESPIAADVQRVGEQIVTVAAVAGLRPGIYDAGLELLHSHDEEVVRERTGFAAMEQDHPRDAAVNVFQFADLEKVVGDLGDRGYRWAQLEAGIRAGRLQVGAFVRGWGAAASTFYDAEVSRFLETSSEPMLMVALGPRR